MGASTPSELIELFSQYFADGDLDGLMTLYEDDAVFPTHSGVASGLTEVRGVLKGYIDSGAKLTFGKSVAFQVGDLGLVQNAWVIELADGGQGEGVTVEVARRQADGTWKYSIDSPDGAALIKDE